MGRAKITMERINNSKKRKLTFNTRKQGLFKKATELTTLCDVNLSIIILADDQPTPEIFPQDPRNLYTLIDLYKLNHCMNPGRTNHYDLADYYVDRKMKIEEELVKTKKKNLEAKYPLWFDFLDNFSETGLREFALGLENKIVDVKRRIDESVNNFVVDNNMMTQLSNPNFENPDSLVNMILNEDDDNMIMQSSNPNLVNPIMTPSLYPDSLMNMMLVEDGNLVCDDGSLWDQFSLMEQFLVSGFPSQVADGTQVFNYF